MSGKRPGLLQRISLTVAIVAGPPCLLVLIRVALLRAAGSEGSQMILLAIVAWVWVSLFIAPAALLFPRRPPREDPGDDSGGGGGGQPDPGPVGPRGDVPLPDATPARSRRRDHRSPLYRRQARRAHPAAPRRVRTGPGRRRTHARGASAHG